MLVVHRIVTVPVNKVGEAHSLERCYRRIERPSPHATAHRHGEVISSDGSVNDGLRIYLRPNLRSASWPLCASTAVP